MVIIVLGTQASRVCLSAGRHKAHNVVKQTIKGINQSNMSMRINDIYANDEVGSLRFFLIQMDRFDESFTTETVFRQRGARA